MSMAALSKNILSDEEIVEYLNSLDSEIPKGQIQSFNPDLIRRIYLLFLDEFGIATHDLGQIPLLSSSLAHSYPTILSSNVTFNSNLTNKMKTFLSDHFGENDFLLKDVLKPAHHRTRKWLTHLIFYHQYIYDNMSKLEEIERNVEEEKESRENLDSNIVDLKSENKQLKKSQHTKLDNLKEVKQKSSEIINRVNILQERSKSLQGQQEGAKDHLRNVQIRKEEISVKMMKKQEKIERLRSHIVTDEDKAKDQEFQRILSEEEKFINDCKLMIENENKTLESLENDADLKGVLKTIKEYSELLEKEKTSVESLNEAKHELREFYKQSELLRNSSSKMSENLSVKERSNQERSEQFNRKKLALERDYEQAKKTTEELCEKRQEIFRKLSEAKNLRKKFSEKKIKEKDFKIEQEKKIDETEEALIIEFEKAVEQMKKNSFEKVKKKYGYD